MTRTVVDVWLRTLGPKSHSLMQTLEHTHTQTHTHAHTHKHAPPPQGSKRKSDAGAGGGERSDFPPARTRQPTSVLDTSGIKSEVSHSTCKDSSTYLGRSQALGDLPPYVWDWTRPQWGSFHPYHYLLCKLLLCSTALARGWSPSNPLCLFYSSRMAGQYTRPDALQMPHFSSES